jgi:hypothetical protein
MQSRGRPKKERKGKIRGPKGAAAATMMAEPARDGDDEVWSPYHCSTVERRATFLRPVKGHIIKE